MKKHNTQSGSVFLYILIGISLFAALSYTVSRGSRTGTGTLTNEQAKLAAQEIIDYGNTVVNAVQKMKLRGCADTEISFENSVDTDYANGNSPLDESCHIFSSEGAGLTFKILNSSISNQNWLFAEGNRVEDVGSNTAGTVDLILALKGLSSSACIEINNLLNNNLTVNPPADTGAWAQDKFTGSYTATDVILNATDGLTGLNSACFEDDSADYVFYQVLIAN